jgi:hypothetical protein
MSLYKNNNEADVRPVTHRELIKAGLPEKLNNKLLAEITGRSVESIRASIHQRKLQPTRDGLFQYLNSSGKQRFRENFRKWAKLQEKKGRYSLTAAIPQATITVIEG